jgi:thiol-disulfide isomerase/thioredoxin
VLAGVFAVAGVAKLADLEGSRSALRAFGVPRSLASPLGTLLPIAELATAGLLVAGMATAGGLAAFVLLALFCSGIAVSLARGRTPDCHCFGQLHSSPAGPGTLARNAALIALAGFVASQADLALSALVAATGFAFAVAGWMLSRRATPADSDGVTRGLAVGAPAPSFELPALEGYTISLRSLLASGKPALLVFSDPHCGPCQALAPEVAEWQRLHSDELTIAVIERRDGSAAPQRDEYGRRTVLLQSESEVADAYGAQGTPTAVLVGADGRVASSVAGGSVGIEALMAESVDRFEPHPIEAEGGSAWTVPVRLGGPLIRRELLVRGAGASAAAGTVLAWPARALGMARARGAPRCDRDRDCPRDTICRRGRCACPPGRGFPDRCAGDCTNVDSDPQRCGGCNRPPCPEGTECAGGNCITGNDTSCNCTSGGGDICCDGACVSPLFDAQSCGGCGVVCGSGQTCCLGRCVDTRSDARYCGGCVDGGEKCAPNQVCHAGRCRDECPKPLRQCGRTCGNPNSQTCCGKKVVIDKEDIANGRMKCCGGEAVNIQSDVENCGYCGCECVDIRGEHECTCQNGDCVCGPNPGSCRFFQP